MSQTCETELATLWDLVDGALDERSAAELREHLVGCPACSDRLAAIERLDAGLQEIANADNPMLPEAIADYRIVRRIGAGGMGIVYEARQPRPDRVVALKVMRPDGDDDSRRLRAFRREIEALGRLNHPSIATVYDAGRTDDGRFYFVMEFVRGQPLDRYCETHALGLRERVELVVRIADAMQFAHDHGIAHRDLKPGNVIVDDTGTPRVLDFGLAKFLDGDDDVTRSGTATLFGTPVGTLPYLAPERLRGAPSDGSDVQADVYALGVVLYELVAGRLPYEFGRATSVTEAARIVENNEPPHPSRIAPAVPRALGDVIATAAAKEPRARYGTIAELVSDLRHYLAGEGVSARAPGLVHRVRRLVARHRGLLAACFVAALLVIAVTGWMLESSTKGVPVTSHLSIARAPASFSVFGRQIDFTADGERAVHLLGVGGRGPSLAIWGRATSTSTPLDLPRGRHSPRWAPDGKRIAMLSSGPGSDWRLSVLHVATGELTEIYRANDRKRQPHDLCWTPDGERITFVTRECAIYDASLAGEVTKWLFTTESDRWELGGYSPDGKWLLCAVIADRQVSEAADLWLVPRGGGRARQLTRTVAHEHSATFDPDGDAVWFVRDDGADSSVFRMPFERDGGLGRAVPERITHDSDRRLRDLDFVGGRDLVCRVTYDDREVWMQGPAQKPRRPLTRGREPLLSPDARTLFFVDGSYSLFALEVDGAAKPVRLTPPLARPDNTFGFAPEYDVAADGRSVVYCAADGAAYGVFVVSESTPPRRLAATTMPVSPRWSRDGSRVAYVDDDRLLVLDHGSGDLRRLASSIWGFEHWTLRWSPAGGGLMVVGYTSPPEIARETNTVFVVDAATGAARRLTPTGDEYKEGVEWHPDGTRLTCLVYADEGECIRDIWLDGRPSTVLFNEPGHSPFVGAWSPSGREYVFWCGGGKNCRGGSHVVQLDGRIRHLGHDYTQPPRWSLTGDAFAWVQPRFVQHFERLHAVR